MICSALVWNCTAANYLGLLRARFHYRCEWRYTNVNCMHFDGSYGRVKHIFCRRRIVVTNVNLLEIMQLKHRSLESANHRMPSRLSRRASLPSDAMHELHLYETKSEGQNSSCYDPRATVMSCFPFLKAFDEFAPTATCTWCEKCRPLHGKSGLMQKRPERNKCHMQHDEFSSHDRWPTVLRLLPPALAHSDSTQKTRRARHSRAI